MGRPGDLDEAAVWEAESDCDAGIMLAAELARWREWAAGRLAADLRAFPPERRDELTRLALDGCFDTLVAFAADLDRQVVALQATVEVRDRTIEDLDRQVEQARDDEREYQRRRADDLL